MANQGLSDPSTADISQRSVDQQMSRVKEDLSKLSNDFVSLTEVWIPRESALFQAWIVWNVDPEPMVVMFRESRHEEPLYRWAIHRALPNETYTNSMMSDIQELNDLGNDQISQTEESRRLASNPPVGVRIDTNVGRLDRFVYGPKKIWPFSDNPRESMQHLNLPDTSTTGLRAWQITTALVNSLAGSGTIAEGQPGRNMPRAGFAVNTLVNLGMSDIQDVAEIIEQDIFTPGLGDIYKITTEFIPANQVLKIPGTGNITSVERFIEDIQARELVRDFTKGQRLKVDDVSGDFDFQWVGSLQFQDQQVRAQRLLVFLNLLTNPVVIQNLANQGFMVNWPDLIYMIWREGLGERGFDRVIIPVNEQTALAATNPEGNVGSNGAAGAVPGLNNLNSLIPTLGLGG